MNTNLFNPIDLVIVPIILLLLIYILNIIKRRQPLLLQKYFFPGFYLRVLGSITISLVYQYVYGYGDTFGYFQITQNISSFFTKNLFSWIEIIVKSTESENSSTRACYDLVESYNSIAAVVFLNHENVVICKLASVFNIICFNSYIAIAMFFGTLSFLGCWYIFKTFVHIFPGYEKRFALLCLYLPSLWFWGNGILKDPVCIFGLGILFYNYFIKEGSLLKRVLLILLGAIILVNIKSYIFYAFLLAAVLGLIVTYYRSFNIIGKILSILLTGIALASIYPLLSEFVSKSFEDIANQSQYFIDQYSLTASEGDSTIIPTFDPSILGFFKLSLQGLVTVYLRPFPWQLNKVLYLFLIIENVYLYKIIFEKIKTGPVEFRKNHKYLTNFSFLFFIFLGIIIGVTAFNLGTTARYRVPALPFLFAGVFAYKLLKRKKRLDKNYMTIHLDKDDKSNNGLASPYTSST